MPPPKKGSENMDRKTQIKIFRFEENQTFEDYIKNINDFLLENESKKVTPLANNSILVEFYI